ncbi:MAG: isocitrate lyase/PEP mutase family protein [Acidimicrobiia bacterium]
MTRRDDPAPAHPLVEAGEVTVVPGVYDSLSARLAERAGFPAVVLTGYGVAATLLGEPDLGLLTQSELLEVARRVCAATDLAVIVDGDTGHGGPLNVQHLVRALAQIGAFGVILEDQTWPKRCGHMRDKSVVDAGEHAAKIRAAVDARGNDHLTITARTDALATHGLDEALRRAHLYKDAGADVLFVEGPRTVEDLRIIGDRLPPPLAVNLIEGGRTPLCSLEELREMGFFSVGFVLSGLYAATRALDRTYRHLRRYAETDSVAGEMADFDEMAEILGVEERLATDERNRA